MCSNWKCVYFQQDDFSTVRAFTQTKCSCGSLNWFMQAFSCPNQWPEPKIRSLTSVTLSGQGYAWKYWENVSRLDVYRVLGLVEIEGKF